MKQVDICCHFKKLDLISQVQKLSQLSLNLLNLSNTGPFFDILRMKLSPTKCKEMLINFMSNHNFIVNPVVIGRNTIERVMTYKLLGVYVSNDLKWNHHVEVIVQKGNRRLYSLRVLKQYGAPPASLAKVYTTIVRPVIEYAAPVWQNIPDFLSYKIESIQKRAMRIIFPLMNYKETLNALNLTTLSDRRAHLCQVYIDRLQNENHPLISQLCIKWKKIRYRKFAIFAGD